MEGEDHVGDRGDVNVTLGQEDDQLDVKVVMVEGQEQFECGQCGKLYKHKRTAESHINKIHKKSKEKVVPEQVEHDDESREDDEEFDMNRLNRWENMASEEGEGLSDATLTVCLLVRKLASQLVRMLQMKMIPK